MTRLALITGGGGFIGTHLVDRLLAAGDRVRVVERPGGAHSHLPLEQIELIEADHAVEGKGCTHCNFY